MEAKKAFTLIELLVVIAIIALLLSVLTPALRRVKQQATGAVCLANLNSLSKSWYIYAEENNGELVFGHVPRNTDEKNKYWVEAPQTESGTYTGDNNPTMEDELRGIRRGTLFPYAQSVKIYHCPGDRGFKGGGGYRSYSITGMMNGEDSTRSPVPTGFADKMSDIISPGDKCVFLENNDNRTWNMGSWVMWHYPDAWTDPISIWHNKRSTLGFADGHAEMHLWLEQSTLKLAEAVMSGGTITEVRTVPADERKDIDYMYKVYVAGPN